ncbi:MAG: dihydroneopterin aldolase [Verrucomicrobiota bacterium]|nr:dihydroneopterin aldolase [Verrucomicrobiota bacterium]
MIEQTEDEIHIVDFEVQACVGVPDEERSAPQRLTISLRITPMRGFRDLADDLSRTVDYAAVCDVTRSFLLSGSFKLIETLADALAAHLLERFAITRLQVEVRKFILPDTRYVAVSILR